jgi:hypothetical protein
MTFASKRDFEKAFKLALSQEQFRHAAVMIRDNNLGAGWNGDWISPWWIEWSRKILSSAIAPKVERPIDIPLWGGDDLFGEKITTGQKKRDA